ncbi:nucleotide exchange factor GrpE [Amycolatopsis sp. lyj-90]|uniref:nucleotide exchange factor GrpE n=1 Tax=Amycolatopsis sp. lyj-90 TaxID=2789285 RepID=UPI00397C2CC1
MTIEETEPQDETAELRAKVADLENRWHLAVADFENLRKRTERDADQLGFLERAKAAAEWLPVLDNLDMALAHTGADPGALIAGLEAVRGQADDVMARLGFRRQDDRPGVSFDPEAHEAVSVVPAPDSTPGTVVAVVRPGYGAGERQLRPASVVVAKGAD